MEIIYLDNSFRYRCIRFGQKYHDLVNDLWICVCNARKDPYLDRLIRSYWALMDFEVAMSQKYCLSFEKMIELMYLSTVERKTVQIITHDSFVEFIILKARRLIASYPNI